MNPENRSDCQSILAFFFVDVDFVAFEFTKPNARAHKIYVKILKNVKRARQI